MRYVIKLKRISDEPEADDGARILVDATLPKDISDQNHGLDEWYSKAAPSSALRKALRKDEMTFPEFERSYRAELSQNIAALTPLLRYTRERGLTLLSAAECIERSYLPVLQETLFRALQEEDEQACGSEPSSPTCYR